MSEKSKRYEKALKALVVFLVVAVVAQTYFVYQLLSDKADVKNVEQGCSANPSVLCPINPTSPFGVVQPAPRVVSRPQNSVNKSVQQQQLMSALQQMLSQQGHQGSQSQVAPNNNKPLNASQPSRRMGIDPMGFGSDPFEEMDRMQQMMASMMSRSQNRMALGGGFGQRYSSPSLTADQNNYIVKMKMSGLDKSDIQAKINGNMLTISGTQRQVANNNQGSQYAQSQSYSQFQNSMSLPGPVNSDKMKVDYQNDTLTITIPKA